ncbi:hypothetical protein [Bacillus massiliglaciei]|uniref:hypothetical protein n=1 Tax=Bacillus massiliglaciei TaxID=1816693 RepID=UPI000DA60B60|nr:hypothetical protein [Bacillus massiliglaciei]
MGRQTHFFRNARGIALSLFILLLIGAYSNTATESPSSNQEESAKNRKGAYYGFLTHRKTNV